MGITITILGYDISLFFIATDEMLEDKHGLTICIFKFSGLY